MRTEPKKRRKKGIKDTRIGVRITQEDRDFLNFVDKTPSKAIRKLIEYYKNHADQSE